MDLTDAERRDNERAIESGVKQVSWFWPASFFKAPGKKEPASADFEGQLLHDAYDGKQSGLPIEWYMSKYFEVIPVVQWPPPQDTVVEAGDVLIVNSGHSLIATGNGEEVSQMWWSRVEQDETWRTGQLPSTILDPARPPEPPPPGSADPGSVYLVTRDRFSDLLARWQGITGAQFLRAGSVLDVKLYKLRPKYRAFGDFTYFNPLRDAFFDLNQAELGPDALLALDADAGWLLANSSARILIEGHCDELGSAQYNQALGERRAAAVRDYLAAKGVEGHRMVTISYGEDKPFIPGHDDASREFNRRAHLSLLP